MDNLEKLFKEIEQKKANKEVPKEDSLRTSGIPQDSPMESKKRVHIIQILSSSGLENKNATWNSWIKSLRESGDNSRIFFLVLTVVLTITLITAAILMYSGVKNTKEIRSITINKETEKTEQAPTVTPTPGVDVCNGVPSLVYEPVKKNKSPKTPDFPESPVVPQEDPDESEESEVPENTKFPENPGLPEDSEFPKDSESFKQS